MSPSEPPPTHTAIRTRPGLDNNWTSQDTKAEQAISSSLRRLLGREPMLTHLSEVRTINHSVRQRIVLAAKSTTGLNVKGLREERKERGPMLGGKLRVLHGLPGALQAKPTNTHLRSSNNFSWCRPTRSKRGHHCLGRDESWQRTPPHPCHAPEGPTRVASLAYSQTTRRHLLAPEPQPTCRGGSLC